MRGRIWLLAALLLWGAGAAHAESLVEAIRRIKPGVVGIGSYSPLRQPQTMVNGTGFVVGDGQHLITNDHVIRDLVANVDPPYLAAMMGDGLNFDVRRLTLVGRDAEHDVALLKFDGARRPTLDFEPEMRAEGTAVALTGFPIGSILGLYPATHHGVVAAITPVVLPQPNARTLTAETILRGRFNVYQLDIVAYPGNSGSPVFDIETGRVIAVLNSTFVKETREQAITAPSGISFAIPIVYAGQLMRRAGLVAR